MLEDQDWIKEALCRQQHLPSKLFFPTEGANTQIKKAQEFCAVCKVQKECLRFALANVYTSGIWGGTTEGERKRMRKHIA
jgi:WhiB family redox-sensing transcriptional regulator